MSKQLPEFLPDLSFWVSKEPEYRTRYYSSIFRLIGSLGVLSFFMLLSEYTMAQATQQWVTAYKDEGGQYALGRKVVTDATGNVYVAGNSRNSNSNDDYLLIKYNPAGVQQWQSKYDGGSYDGLTDLVIDASGNLYLTGNSRNANNNDYATVKYNAAGEQQWVARYNGNFGTNSDDNATAMAVDAQGNVYVTGQSIGSATTNYSNYDYATVKYNAAGEQQWVARYSGNTTSLNNYSYDYATDIAVDKTGNVYVTGQSMGNVNNQNNDYDYATIKYNTAGVQQWVARYSGNTSNTNTYSYDIARALALDSEGNVYVTGLSMGNVNNEYNDYDYLTVKYNAAGVQQWTARYNGNRTGTNYYSYDTPVDMLLDAQGNVYVTGESSNATLDEMYNEDYDYATVKYNAAGEQQWVARYSNNTSGANNYSYDTPTAIVQDEQGYIYVTGQSMKESTNNMNYYDMDYATVKYNTAGEQQWVARYSNSNNATTNNNDSALDLATDSKGNVYVTGQSYNGKGYEIATVKYSSNFSAVISSTAPNPTNISPIPVSIEFGNSVTDFALTDIVVTGGTAANLTGSNKQYFVEITPTGEGEIKIDITEGVVTDELEIVNASAQQFIIIYDHTAPDAPVIASISTDTGINNADKTTSDNTLLISGTAEAHTVITLQEATAGKIGTTTTNEVGNWVFDHEAVELLEGKYSFSALATDAAGNTSTTSTVQDITVDKTAPTVTIQSAAKTAVNAPFQISMVFNEPVYTVTPTTIQVENATVSEVATTDGLTYTATVTPVQEEFVKIQIPVGAITDLAGNPNTLSNELVFAFDKTAPAGYTATFRQSKIDFFNQRNAAVNITGTEVGATYYYTITSSKGGTPLEGNGIVEQVQFSIMPLDLTSLPDGKLIFTLYLQDAAGNQGVEVRSEVEKLTRNIVAVTQPATIQVPIRTTFLQVPLPANIEVTYSDNTKQAVAVTWQPGNYNAYTAGEYEITGILTLAPGTSNQNNLQARIIVEVQPNKAPTGLALSTTTFDPSITPNEAIGSFSTVDPDDQEFTYSLASGSGDTNNSLFEVRQGQLFLKSNKGLSGQTQFTIRVRTTDPYKNTFEQSFTLTKAAYAKAVDQLKIVNAFSPNGDGVNDEWSVPELKFYNKVNIEVFDRAGVRLFQTTNPEKGWNGQNLNGKVLAGAYLYIIQVEDIKLTKKGVVTVLKK